MPVWRHVNIGTINSGQNICPISIIKVGQQFCEMSLYENTEELFGGFEEYDYLCIRYLTYWNKAERRRQEVSKPLPIKVLLVCKWLIIKRVAIRLADISGIKNYIAIWQYKNFVITWHRANPSLAVVMSTWCSINRRLRNSSEWVLSARERHLSLPHKDVHMILANELLYLSSVMLRVNQIASVCLFHHSCSFIIIK